MWKRSHSVSHYYPQKLEENIRESRAEANALRQQLDKARPVSAQKSPAPLDLSIGSAVGGAASSPAAPFEDLSRIVPLSPLLVSSAKEEYEEKLRAMSTMLSDCEQRIQQFAAQEQVESVEHD